MEEKIKIDFKKKAIGSFKVGEQTIKVKPWLDIKEAAFIVDESCSYFKDLISQNQSDAIATSLAFAKMNLLITALATNLDLEDIDADVVGSAGIFNIMEEKVMNYNIIKDSVLSGMNMIGNGLIIDQLSNIASLDDLEKAQNQISDYMQNNEYSDKVKGLIEVMLANNPKVANELEKLTISGDENNDGDKK